MDVVNEDLSILCHTNQPLFIVPAHPNNIGGTGPLRGRGSGYGEEEWLWGGGVVMGRGSGYGKGEWLWEGGVVMGSGRMMRGETGDNREVEGERQ